MSWPSVMAGKLDKLYELRDIVAHISDPKSEFLIEQVTFNMRGYTLLICRVIHLSEFPNARYSFLPRRVMPR